MEPGEEAVVDNDDSGLDFSTFGDSPETAETAETAQTQTAEEKTPGAWDAVLGSLPDDATRAMIKPHLATWDTNVNKRFESIHKQYEPYKEFYDNKVDPGRLAQGYDLMSQIDANPVAFMEKMRDALVSAGMYAEAKQVQDELEESEEDEVDPRISALEQQQQAFMQQMEESRNEQQQHESARQAEISTDNEVAALEQKYGPMNERYRTELFTRAVMMNQMQGRFVPLAEVNDSLQNFIADSRRASPGNRAPKVLPPGGGLPVAQNKAVGDMNEAERRAAVAAVIERTRGGNK